MTRSTRRITLVPGYVLHHRPWRDTSRILEVLTRTDGRFTLFARGVRGPAARLAPVLRPFQLLLLSWSGRGEAGQLTAAEPAQASAVLPARCLMAAYYLNELLIRLTTRHDPLPELFDHYHGTLESLRGGAPLERTLRLFEKQLLLVLGYGIDLAHEAHSGRPIDEGGYYHFRPGQGLVAAAHETRTALAGSSLLNLARDQLSSARELADARRLLGAALEACLEGRPLVTRAVAKSLARRVLP